MILNINGQQGTPATIRYRVVDPSGTVILPSQVQNVQMRVFDTGTNIETTPTGGSSIAGAFSVLTAWPLDSIGFNCQVTVPGTCLPLPDTTYQVEVFVTISGGYYAFYLDHVQILAARTFGFGA